MLDVLRWVGDGFRAVVGTMIMLTPGIVFWFVVIGIMAIIQRWKIWESLRVVVQKVAAAVSTE